MSTTTLTGIQKSHTINNNSFVSIKTNQYNYTPLVKGSLAPVFNLQTQQVLTKYHIYGSLANEQVINLQDFLDYGKPLVVVFYSTSINTKPPVEELESLQADVDVMGGKLLIITNSHINAFRRALKQQEYSLTVYHDENNLLAEDFGLYDELNPLWHWVSGVDNDNMSLPAVYVIAPDREIVYRHVNYSLELFSSNNFSNHFSVREMLTAVYQNSQKNIYNRLGKRIVS